MIDRGKMCGKGEKSQVNWGNSQVKSEKSQVKGENPHVNGENSHVMQENPHLKVEPARKQQEPARNTIKLPSTSTKLANPTPLHIPRFFYQPIKGIIELFIIFIIFTENSIFQINGLTN